MAIHIHGKQMQLTQALQEYAERKLGPLQQWFERPVDIQVSMAVQGHKHEQRIEVTIPYRGVVFRAEERQPDMTRRSTWSVTNWRESCVNSRKKRAARPDIGITRRS